MCKTIWKNGNVSSGFNGGEFVLCAGRVVAASVRREVTGMGIADVDDHGR